MSRQNELEKSLEHLIERLENTNSDDIETRDALVEEIANKQIQLDCIERSNND